MPVLSALEMLSYYLPFTQLSGWHQNGTVTQDFGINCVINGVAIQSDGKIVAAEEPFSPGYFWKVGRYNSDGSLDTTFGNNGIVTTAMISSDYNIPHAIVIQPDQKLIVVGWTATSSDGNENLAVVRYNPDGSLDDTFGNGGEVITKVAGSAFIGGYQVALQQDGKIVVFGNLTYGGNASIFTVRFNPNGSFDTSFNNNGYVTEQLGVSTDAVGLALQSDGKIVITGSYDPSNTSERDTYIIRYNSDGSRDTSFADNGLYINSFGVNWSQGNALAIQTDGKIVLGGFQGTNSTGNFALRRFNTDGTLDSDFGTNGSIITQVGSGDNQIQSLVLQSDGKILAGGSANNGSYSDWALARYADVGSIPNQAPSINPISNTTINEGDTYSVNGSFTDPDSTSWTATVDYGDSSGASSLTLFGTNFSLSHTYKDNGLYTVTVSVTDNQGATGTQTAQVTVNNVNPSVGAIIVSANSLAVNTSLTATASFSDPGVLDTHTAVWNWGDGTTPTPGNVNESSGSGTVTGSHPYATAGVYTITLTVTDNNAGVGTAQYQYVAVYDPTAGFLTGAGKYNSLAGWDTQNPQALGEVKFGIEAKYTSGNTPTGQTKIDFKAGNLVFNSTSCQWLVVNGAKAILKGSGTINGSGTYTFLISVIDGSQTGGQNLIRIKITDTNNNVVYDTQMGAPDTADPTTVITNGSIKIHQ